MNTPVSTPEITTNWVDYCDLLSEECYSRTQPRAVLIPLPALNPEPVSILVARQEAERELA